MSEQQDRHFFRTYDLTKEQRQPKDPAAHQQEALKKLNEWFQEKPKSAGSILVLPTGGGKTFTASRFLCTAPLPNGYKVLWLAHTHHLLEQAFYSFESEVKLIHQRNNNKQQLNMRVVSGTKGHFHPSHIKPTDDVVISTLQTVTRAHQNALAQLNAFLKEAGDKLFVVFDEAHHSPAPSYYRLISKLRENHTGMYLLGLTATPTYIDKKKSGRLKQLFTQGICYQVSPKELMAAKILAQPIFEESQTTFIPEFDESKYKQWVRDYQDLPEEIITKLADNRDRNTFIAKTYAENKEHYGKTIIFADRWFQCEQLREFLKQQNKSIRVGTVYSHVDAAPGSADARNKQDKDENAKVIEAFRNDRLDVLINVRMLTEGTDVPNVNTVFLTRKTTSKILLTQMVGRALRGSEFGGTDQAYIVSFVDNWQHSINWAEYDPLEETPTADDVTKVISRLPMQLISIDLVRRLVRQMDSGVNINPASFLTFMPIGWYRVEFETLIEGNENTEIAQRLVMVFENEKESYERFIKHLKTVNLQEFTEAIIQFESHHQRIEDWQQEFFSDVEEHIGGDLLAHLFHIALHMAQNEKEPPDWFNFEQRDAHNLDAVAQKFIAQRLHRREEDEKLSEEYNRKDRYWKIIYYSYELFKSQYNACVEWLLVNERCGNNSKVKTPSFKSESVPPPEPSERDKNQVKKRDSYRCLCCGEENSGSLQVDHIKSRYFGGDNSLDNLQTLCEICNRTKNTQKIDFRKHETILKTPPSEFIKLDLQKIEQAAEVQQWQKFISRSVNFFYRCAAVDFTNINGFGTSEYPWEIYLHPGNNPDWFEPHRGALTIHIRTLRSKFGFTGPYVITMKSTRESKH